MRDELFILDDANVDGTIAAGTVVVSGRYNGTLNCNNRLEVLPTGRVRGEIFAPTLVVHNGAVVNSKITNDAESEMPNSRSPRRFTGAVIVAPPSAGCASNVHPARHPSEQGS